MKKFILLFALLFTLGNMFAQTSINEDVKQLKKEVSVLKEQLDSQKSMMSDQQKKNNSLQTELDKSKIVIDSLQSQVSSLTSSLSSTEKRLETDISETNQTVKNNAATLNKSISTKTIIGLISLLALASLAGLGLYLLRRKVSNSDAAIDAVRGTQRKLEEESVKLDNQLITILNNQLNAQPLKSQSSSTDHSLVLKVADEITRIELNLSRMDPSVKGFKQLTKGIERIKNNYLSKGYEIADMLNKPYNEGMRINADFVLDENLEPGTRIITSITKPQVIYNGELIQKAIVTVTQNI